MTIPLLDPVLERLDRLARLVERAVVALENIAGRKPTTPGATSTQGSEPLWDVEATAKFLNCSTSKIYKAAEAGTLPCVRDGRNLRFKPTDIRTHVDRLSKTTAAVLPMRR